ncbi:uncharacterized protein BDR25DRAFT_362684 [Lindgomyces ingoldianus]|uniref:Uncharacterized protein n=1 Tax=Lindgomyces ingoldianus TaxID=673940 RepID=A0ACB6Q9D5_9PLEO|nr:uncharacterized protein BDR25DRAFT_362684 [Lindgomyces ingoldianus]KAF2463511.1 hypothetical protein BDR25DRAFT_362684 [Lindgomyces ingoldianus]
MKPLRANMGFLITSASNPATLPLTRSSRKRLIVFGTDKEHNWGTQVRCSRIYIFDFTESTLLSPLCGLLSSQISTAQLHLMHRRRISNTSNPNLRLFRLPQPVLYVAPRTPSIVVHETGGGTAWKIRKRSQKPPLQSLPRNSSKILTTLNDLFIDHRRVYRMVELLTGALYESYPLITNSRAQTLASKAFKMCNFAFSCPNNTHESIILLCVDKSEQDNLALAYALPITINEPAVTLLPKHPEPQLNSTFSAIWRWESGGFDSDWEFVNEDCALDSRLQMGDMRYEGSVAGDDGLVDLVATGDDCLDGGIAMDDLILGPEI